MKLQAGEIPEPEIDEFGDEVVKPIISREYINEHGNRVQELANFQAVIDYEHDLMRNRDQAMLERGEIDQEGLRRKNGFLEGIDPKRFRIVAIGDRKYEDID